MPCCHILRNNEALHEKIKSPSLIILDGGSLPLKQSVGALGFLSCSIRMNNPIFYISAFAWLSLIALSLSIFSTYWIPMINAPASRLKKSCWGVKSNFLNALDFDRFNSGSAQPSLNRNFIYPIPIRVPKPAEQKAIATVEPQGTDTSAQSKPEGAGLWRVNSASARPSPRHRRFSAPTVRHISAQGNALGMRHHLIKP